MKKTSSAFILVLIAFTAFSQGRIDVLHYKFDIELNDKNDSIAGTAFIKFIRHAGDSVLTLDLSNINADGKGMIVKKARMFIGYGFDMDLTIGSYTHANNKVSIKGWKEKFIGDTLTAIISYYGIPSDGLIISKNRYGKRTFFADNWPDRAHHWIPCHDDPADKATFEFLINAPSHYKVISNGVLQEEKELPDNKKLTHWKEDIPLPTKVMVIGVADFAVDHVDTVNSIPVSSWVFEQNRIAGFKDYAIAPSILSFMIDYIGPYPFKKLANVQSKTIFGGMENASAIFYAENSVNGERNQQSLFAHEIAHQWFGDMATEKSYAHLWLSEGFATYLSHLYIKSRYGVDSFYRAMEKDRREVIGFTKINRRPVVDSISSYMELLNANSYQKGGWVLHMLYHQLGDSLFRQSIRKYYSAYAGKNADTRDFQKIVEEVSGKDLSVFFQQWLYTPGIPRLEMSWSYSEKKLTISVKQLQKDVFQFPLDFMITTSSGESQPATLQVNQPIQSLTIPMNVKPAMIKPDPGVSLLFEGSIAETK